MDRARGQRLDRTDFSDLSSAPRKVHNRTTTEMEKLVLNVRQQLRETSDLGEFGAAAISRELSRRGLEKLPGVRTIGYILERHGALDSRHRVRRQAPAAGWYVPDLQAGLTELDQFDFVEGLIIEGGVEVEVLNVISLHGGLVGSWPDGGFTAELALSAMLGHWRACGLPDYAQFDNDTRFQGPHQHPDTIGRVIRVCLSLAVVPVFAPPREHGLQNGVESYNGRWQAKVWARFHHEGLAGLQARSAKYVAAYRERSKARTDHAPPRRAFPQRWSFDRQAKISSGRIIYIRRTSDRGKVEVLGRQYEVAQHWVHRLVRCEVDIAGKEIRFYGLRRREPSTQPLLGKVAYELPPRYIS
ncbi:MAG: hypothetical protein LC775_05620 [Acidobacteria bacterium]|nr:hypothetical protein [Acidobacteriota bacterium]